MSDPERQRAPRLARLATQPAVQIALGLVAVALAIAVGAAWGRRTAPRDRRKPAAQPPLPEAHPVWDAWRAAWDGDVAAHLACFTGPARERLDAELEAKGREALAEQLRGRGAEALAIELARPEPQPDGSVVLPVTVQHERDAERIDYRAVFENRQWSIAEIVPRGRVSETPPYGERLAPPAQQGDNR